MTPRCFVDPAEWSRENIRLRAEDAHHLTGVLRAGPGSTVTVGDGQGGEAEGEIIEAGPGGVVGQTLGIVAQQHRHVVPIPGDGSDVQQAVVVVIAHHRADGVAPEIVEVVVRQG